MKQQENSTRTDKQHGRVRGAVTGVASAGLLFGVAQLLSAFFSELSSPLVSVGSTFIDFTPAGLKDFAIATFGTNDKMVLLLSMAAVAVILSAIAGIIARTHRKTGIGMVLAFALVMAVCVLTRAGAGPTDLLPLVAGTVAGILALMWLTPPTSSPGTSSATQSRAELTSEAAASSNSAGPNRRTFIVKSGLILAGAAVAGWAGTALSSARNTANQVREALKLPKPASAAKPLPNGVQSAVKGVSPFITPNDDFYRIDTALVVPVVDPSSWELRVHGMVEEEFTMSFDELLASELVERHVTLTCVSNVVGGNLVGNAKWLGYPLREVLARAKPKAGADMVLSTSVDGFSASTPLPILQDDRDALLAVGMNDEPLPLDHGFPVRMVVPGLYGFVSATKWVVDLEVTTFEQKAGYWTSRGWSSHGPIKTSSRVEVPRALARVPAGKVSIGGSAWAQTKGISKVEIQLDGGDWQAAELAAEASVDTWRQWSYIWDDAPAGTHQVRVRAYDNSNELQIEEQAPPAPDGSSGWHSITFTVE